MDLCTVISEKFIPQAVNLIHSYNHFSFRKNVFLYYFNCDKKKLKIFNEAFGSQVKFIEVQDVCDHALEPRVFFYKVYAINDCLLNHSKSMIYSDSANCFIKPTKDLKSDLIDQSLFLIYPYEKLSNKYWTTTKCIETMQAPLAELMPQYWAGFQVYRDTEFNKSFVTQMYDYMLMKEVALPDTTIKRPDGPTGLCVEHRQDQSVLSVLIHKNNRHQFFDLEKNNKYGDWQTLINFNKNYKHDFSKIVLSPRESKFGNYRFLNV